MSNELSIISADENIDLQNNKTDIGVTLAKAILGIAPLGSLFGEILTTTIPNQRMDRIALGLEVVNQKLHDLQEDVSQKLGGEYSEMFYEVVNQLSKTNSEERRHHLASLLKNSLTDEELELIEKEKLLLLLGQLNDPEVIFLKLYSLNQIEQQEFYSQHEKVLRPIGIALGRPQIEYDKNAFRRSYTDRLTDLGLAEAVPARFKKGEMPPFDESTGKIKTISTKTTRLGNLLLRYIDMNTAQDQNADVG